MKQTLLLPRKCRTVGWVLFPLSLVNLYALWQWDFKIPFLSKHHAEVHGTATTDVLLYDFNWQIALGLAIISIFMIAFSREKTEDEYVQNIRLRSLLISIYMHSVLLLGITLFFLNSFFLEYAVLSIVPLLFIFVVVYNFQLHIKPMLSKQGRS